MIDPVAPRGQPIPILADQLGDISSPIADAYAEMGYQNPGDKLTSVKPELIVSADGLIVNLHDSAGALFALTPSGSLDYVNSLLATVTQHAPGLPVEFWVDGSCRRFSAVLERQGCSLADNDLQPRA